MPPGPGKPFEKGHKLARGGRRDPPGGRPTREEAELKRLLAQKFWAQVEKRIDTLLSKYFREKGVARDVINRVVPYAKQTVALEQGTGALERAVRHIEEVKKARARKEAETKLIEDRMNGRQKNEVAEGSSNLEKNR
jgi:hypothetical protein